MRSPLPRRTSRKKPQATRTVLSVEALEERCVLSTTDMVVQWNAIANQAAVVDYSSPGGTQLGPTRLGRAMAIVQSAVFDSVNSIDPEYKPYLIQVTAAKDASIDAAVAQAAHDTLVAMWPHQQPYFDSQLAASLSGIPIGPAADGVAVGAAVAEYTLGVRDPAHDGSLVDAAGQPVNYVYGQQPGQWRADPLHPTATPLTPDWGGVTPFGMQSESQFLPPPPPALDSEAYAKAYLEVKLIGSSDSAYRTAEQTDIGVFWGYDAQPTVCAPVRFYNQIAETLAQQEGNSEVDNARFFALINIAMADAGITCWGAKYQYDLWRPITAIRENDPGSVLNYPGGWPGSDNPYLVGQGDPTWMPYGAPGHGGNTNFTPPFPSYTSGHATFGGALFKMMEDFYGTDNIHFTIATDEYNTVSTSPLQPRSFDSFSQAAGENAESRIYLGIHYQFDAVQGIKCGDEIADYDFQHLMVPLHGHAPKVLPSMNPEAQIDLAIDHEDAASRAATNEVEREVRSIIDQAKDKENDLICAVFAAAGKDSHDQGSSVLCGDSGSSATSPSTTGLGQTDLGKLCLGNKPPASSSQDSQGGAGNQDPSTPQPLGGLWLKQL